MTSTASHLQAYVQEELLSRLTKPRRRHAYFVWPYGSHTPRAACATLTSAMQEVAHAQRQGVTDVWIVRSDGCEVQAGCTNCGRNTEAIRVASDPVLRDYWCPPCWKVQGKRIVSRRLSPLQQRILRWLQEDATRAPGRSVSSHKALVKALQADKGNISKSLRNLAAKNWIHLHTPPHGNAVTIELTPTGSYKASSLTEKKKL
jgi:DNA-binding MarR family transcriptional regulator